ncbi:MAG: type II CRISPR-associated endonuclease Cas1, partial [Chitinophagales bacterium]|nr:type II CRISPR-associated endonuclease Cas1 [Chitinophagales bacterium]
MHKRILYFGKPARLSIRLNQLVIHQEDGKEQTVPVEDTGLVFLDHQQITVTHAVLLAFTEHNVALISCNDIHLPAACLLPLCGHSL